MNELVQVQGGKVVVSSRQVAEKFGKMHKHVIASIKAIEEVDENSSDPLFVKSSYVHSQNGQSYLEYLMNRDGFALLTMGFTGAKALQWKKKYIQAFNSMEEALQNKLLLPNFNNPAEAARAWADQVELRGIAEKKVFELTPKGEFYDTVMPSESELKMSEVAKVLAYKGIGRTKLFAFLRNKGILQANREPYQQFVNRGYFRSVESTWKDKNDEVHVTTVTVVKQKGLEYIDKLLKENGYTK